MAHFFIVASATAIAAATGLWTAQDPFVGKWELDVSRSVIVDQMVVEAAGPNAFTFKFEGGPAETIVADGKDQPALQGTTLAVKADDSRTLRVVRRRDGHIVISAVWKLSEDGQVLRDSFTQTQADGSTLTTDYVYKRMSGTSGFVGNWESITKPTGLKFELEIRPYGEEGFSFVRQGSVKSVTFDGQDHAVASEGDTASGRRRSERAMELTDKHDGNVVDTQSFSLSQDGKTLTINVHRTGQVTVGALIFARG